MKFAIYFLGCCFLIWAAVIYWCVSLALGVVDDAKVLVQKAPVIMDRAEIVIEDARRASIALEQKIESARSALSVDAVKKVGSAATEKAGGLVKLYFPGSDPDGADKP